MIRSTFLGLEPAWAFWKPSGFLRPQQLSTESMLFPSEPAGEEAARTDTGPEQLITDNFQTRTPGRPPPLGPSSGLAGDCQLEVWKARNSPSARRTGGVDTPNFSLSLTVPLAELAAAPSTAAGAETRGRLGRNTSAQQGESTGGERQASRPAGPQGLSSLGLVWVSAEPNWSQLGHTQLSGPSHEGPWSPRPQAGALRRRPSAEPGKRGRREEAPSFPLLRPDLYTAEGSQGSRWVFSPERTPPLRVCQGAHNQDTGVRQLQRSGSG